MRRTIALVALAVLLSGVGTSFATMDKVGSSSALFLKIGMDSRGVAMGEAYSASATGVPSVFSNPAGVIFTAANDSNINSIYGGIFHNEGTFIKSPGTGITDIGSNFNNDGTVTVST